MAQDNIARGLALRAGNRMDRSLTEYGIAKRGILFKENALAMRSKVGVIRNGGTPYTARLLMAGDSWIDGRSYFVRELWTRMRALLGGSHSGFVSAGKSIPGGLQAGADQSLTVTQSSGVVNNVATGNGPALSSVTLAAGDSVTLTISSAASGRVATVNVLSGDSGTYSYDWGSGATNVVLSGSGPQSNTANGYPGSGAARTITITAVEGPVTLYGWNVLSGTTTGFVLDKCGHGSTSSVDWAAADWNIVGALWAMLNPDAVVLHIGGNDQGDSVPLDTYEANMTNIVQNVRTHLPVADVILSCPPERSILNPTYPMADYRDRLAKVAFEQGCVLVDHCRIWGPEPRYGFRAGGGTLGLIDNTERHPTNLGGGVMAETWFDFLTNLGAD